MNELFYKHLKALLTVIGLGLLAFTLNACGQGQNHHSKTASAIPSEPESTTPSPTLSDSDPGPSPGLLTPPQAHIEQECSSENADLNLCNSAKTLCQLHKQKTAWAKENGQPVKTFSWDRVQSQQLVLIGDEHGLSDPASLLILIAKAKTKVSNANSCFFFEIPSSKTLEEFTAVTEEKSAHGETEKFRSYYKKILSGTKLLGFKIFMVDHPKNDGTALVEINERDRFMASKISSLFETGECQQGVMIIGKAHIAADVRGRKTLVQNLMGRLSLSRLNPVFAKDWERPVEANAWNGLCRSSDFTPSEALIFSNEGIAYKPVYPLYSWLMNYGAFDFTILFP